MEIFGIIFSIPVLFICSYIYLSILKPLVNFLPWTKPVFLIPATVVLAAQALEYIGIITAGSVNLRAFIGPIFYKIHIILFFLAVPSLATFMHLQKRFRLPHSKFFIALVCAIVGAAVVLFQYGVSEALYGLNGNDGPYSYEPHYITDMFTNK